jgi:NNP family nitrate/nitrite transporter-like MFS transporter
MAQMHQPGSARQIAPVLFLMGVMFLNFASRVIFSPLLPVIESSLGLSHAQAGGLFLLISLGYSAGMLLSGFISRRLTHRGTILLSALLAGLSLALVASSPDLPLMRGGLVLLGYGAGLYLPSGVATLTSAVDARHWGKAIALHEIGPNLGLIVSPILAQALIRFISWRQVLLALAAANLLAGLLFILFGRGGRFPGEPPRLGNIRRVCSQSSFWVMTLLFSLTAASSIGVYSFLPTFLIGERGMSAELANTLVGLSRVSGLVAAVVSGWLVDRFRLKTLLRGVGLLNGLLTVLLGLIGGPGLVALLFVQAMVVAAFFPVAYAALARIGPPRLRNLAISLMIPFSFLVAGGVVPALFGLLGEQGRFSLGFVFLGLLLLASPVSLALLRLPPAGGGIAGD